MRDSTFIVYVDPAPLADVAPTFRDAGATVEHVTTLEACRRVLSKADCIVCDRTASGIGSVELCECVRSRRSDVPIVVFTADGSETFAGDAIAAGADGYVPKSQGVDTLEARVDDLLADREATTPSDERDGKDRMADLTALDRRRRLERDRFVALFENVPDAVASVRYVDGEPVVERVNPSFERIFGYGEGEIDGEPIAPFVVPNEQEAGSDVLEDRGDRGDVVDGAVKRRTTNGLRDFELQTVPIANDDATDRAFVVYTDVTQWKRRQKRVEILDRVLRHDLRNGMNIVEGCAELLADAVEDDDQEHLETIRERATELIELAEKTRAVERTLERSDATGPVDLVDSVDAAIDRLEARYPDVDVACSLPDRAVAQADDHLETAIFHVLENAVVHNDRMEPAVEVTLECSDDGGPFVLSIADDGPGIPDEERELLQEEKEITQLHHASGLGLWFVNWVVAQFGGTISFEDNDPRGTVVELRVPRASVVSSHAVGEGATADD
ncbi:ATP-binding protein [Natribaculum luteum]|uniref:histidine kinase n=1 Tax=Natribaculum luteum TaxID=1586232 RepID=A0ABD5P0Z7_9EURY|nr:ATP-binding protein [Natribaculum luteum]